MAEQKSEKFSRLAEARTNKIIDTIRLLGNLSNQYHYEYTQEQVDAIFDAIQEELDTQRKKFEPQKGSKRKFRL